jgi:small subunit ribosomal protein S2
MGGLPDVIFVIDVEHEEIAITEAKKLSIPVIGVVDTNSSPDNVDYVIPGNDDAIRSIRLFVAAIADAALEGKAEFQGEVSADEFVEVAETEAPAEAEVAEAAPEDAPEAVAETPAEDAPEAVAETPAEAAPATEESVKTE